MYPALRDLSSDHTCACAGHRVPQSHTDAIKSLDEIWVPSHFSRDVLTHAGIPPHKVQNELAQGLVLHAVASCLCTPSCMQYCCMLVTGACDTTQCGHRALQPWDTHTSGPGTAAPCLPTTAHMGERPEPCNQQAYTPRAFCFCVLALSGSKVPAIARYLQPCFAIVACTHRWSQPDKDTNPPGTGWVSDVHALPFSRLASGRRARDGMCSYLRT